MPNKKLTAVLVMLTLLTAVTLSRSGATVPVVPLTEIETQLFAITEEEREVLEDLFLLLQEIEEIERQQLLIESEIILAEERSAAVEKALDEQQLLFNDRRDVLGEVLKSYQRRGPGSTLGILMASENFPDFIKRINVLRELTKNTGDLLDELAEKQAQLNAERENLQRLIAEIELKRADLAENLRFNLGLQAELEAHLASLQEERAYYEEKLSELDRAWQEINGIFSAFVSEFSRLVEDGSLPEGAITITFSLPDIKGTIREAAFNRAITDSTSIRGMALRFRPDRIIVHMPAREFELTGIFEIEDGDTLKFIAETGSFYGLPLTESSIQELFSDGVLALNLAPVLMGNQLHTVNIYEGSLELISRPPQF